MMKKKFYEIKGELKREEGATAVFVALALVLVLSIVALVIDLGAAYSLKAKMQAACDLSALGAAKKLPNVTEATNEAYRLAEANGFESGEVHVNVFGAANRVQVAIKKSNKTLFAGVMGVNSLDVGCRAVASSTTDFSAGGDFDYAVFSGSETQNLDLNFVSLWNVTGKIHSNESITGDVGVNATSISQSSLTNPGYLGANTHTEDGKTYPGSPSHQDVVEMPYYLGDNIDKVIITPTLPSNNYWDIEISTNNMGNYTGAGGPVIIQALNDKKKVHIKYSGGTMGGWINYQFNSSTDIYFESHEDASFQFAGGPSVIQISETQYPVWDSATVYLGSSMVSYNGKIYRAKWWTQGNQPDQGEPWEFVANEDSGSSSGTQPSETQSSDSQYPAWDSATVYLGSSIVSYNGSVYQAKWWTQGDTPGASDVWELISGGGNSSGGNSGGNNSSASPGGTIKGDVYITNPGHLTRFGYSGATTTVNGNIYCISGDLTLDNVIVKGNIYCAGKLTTEGTSRSVKGGMTYIYGNSITIGSGSDLAGVFVADNDITFLGDVTITSSTEASLTTYSRGGDILIGTRAEIHGYMFAPYGDISFQNGLIKVYGKIIGNTINKNTKMGVSSGAWEIHVSLLDTDLGFDTTDPNPKPAKKVVKLIE